MSDEAALDAKTKAMVDRMFADGVAKGTPDGRVELTATAEQLAKYGIDREALDRATVQKNWRKSKSEASAIPEVVGYKFGEHDNLRVVRDKEGKILLIPATILERAGAGGERFERLSQADVDELRKNPTMTASLVLGYEQDTGQYTVTDDIDGASKQVAAQLAETQAEMAVLDEKIADLKEQKMGAGQVLVAQTMSTAKGGKQWTRQELIDALGIGTRGGDLIDDMVENGYVLATTKRGRTIYTLRPADTAFYKRYLSTLEGAPIFRLESSAINEDLKADLLASFKIQFGRDMPEEVVEDLYTLWLRSMINQRALSARYGLVYDTDPEEAYRMGEEEGFTRALVNKYVMWAADPDQFQLDNWPSPEGLEEHHYTSVYWDSTPESEKPVWWDMAKEIAHGRLPDPRQNQGRWFEYVNTRPPRKPT